MPRSRHVTNYDPSTAPAPRSKTTTHANCCRYAASPSGRRRWARSRRPSTCSAARSSPWPNSTRASRRR
ncbi:hypothetical protein VTK73DRAFT_2001 [Phialemonium thermophilum]|uniref:Uncharacterized protein n=1 Tax=Phialemonium thermophilum TaxID=223376 RepID=A0ABR3VSQ2_9PEZI